MGLHSNLPIYKVSYDLIGVVVDAARQMPRDVKRLLGEKLRDECIELSLLIYDANVSADKKTPLATLLRRVQAIEIMLRVSRDKRWKSMMARCHNPKASNYCYYGARGITVCERWHKFAAFRADMGECPDCTMTLDRKKNDIGYEPGNCRWRTQAQQSKNRSNCVELTHNGVTQIVAIWARQIGITPNALRSRLRLGWTAERALTTPLQPGRFRKS